MAVVMMDLDLRILPPQHRISPEQLSSSLRKQNCDQRHLLVDVRSESEFRMCNIDGSTNYPIEKLSGHLLEDLVGRIENESQVTFVCRRGNDSQVAASRVLAVLPAGHHDKVTDLSGGLHAWAKRVDRNFPVY